MQVRPLLYLKSGGDASTSRARSVKSRLPTYIHTYLCIHHTHLPTQVNVDDRLAILRFNKFLQGRLKLPIHLLCLLQYVLTYIIIYIK